MYRSDDGRPVLALTLGYRGGGFSGFAKQPGLRTIQGEIEQALLTLLQRDITVIGAGRTDTGVHAWGQVVSFPVEPLEAQQLDTRRFLRSLNALTGDDLVFRGVQLREPGFSARFSATMREYRYYIATGPVPPLFIGEMAAYQPVPLDLDAMRAAAVHLVGEHDFRSFCVTASADLRPTTRTLTAIEIAHDTLHLEPVVVITVRGRSFLHSMVRNIVGTLIDVGKGRHEPDWVGQVLAARTRELAGPTAPARGLVFYEVTYPQ